MYKKTEKFQKSNGSPDLESILLIDPDNGVGPAHDYFPDDLFDDLMWPKTAIFRDWWGIVSLLELDKLSGTHPQIVNMPTLKNVSEVFSEQQTFKSPITVYNIDPTTMMHICHHLKGLP